MNVINNTINRMNFLILDVSERINNYSEDELSAKPNPVKWSKKEILGHLCDSATNNLSRFIRAQLEDEPFRVVPYRQDEWVKLNGYNEMKAERIVKLWCALNLQITNVISRIPEEKLAVKCDLGDSAFREGESEKNLLWLIEDYLIHMEYHLNQIFN